MPEYLYIFGYETPRQRRNNALHDWDDEDSHGVLIESPNEEAALQWGNRIAQKYVSQLHNVPEVDWSKVGFSGFIEHNESNRRGYELPKVTINQFPNFSTWLEYDRAR